MAGPSPTPPQGWKDGEVTPASIVSSQTARNVLMSRLAKSLHEHRLDDALSDLEQFLQKAPQDRECQLLRLVCNIKIHGLQPYENEIEKLKAFPNLDYREKQALKYIFGLVVEQSKLERRDDKAVSYQRLIRRLVRGSSLVDPCSTAEKIIELGYVVRGRILRILRLKERVSRKELGWCLAGLLGLVVMSVSLVQNNSGSSRDQTPPKVQAVRQDASVNRVLGVNDLGVRLWGGNQDAESAGQILQGSEVQVSSLVPLYEDAIQRQPDLMGSMVLQLNVDTSGAVTEVNEVYSRLKDPEFRESVIKQASKWKFIGNRSGPLQIEYPLLFVPRSMDPMTLVRWELALTSTPEEEKTEKKTATYTPESAVPIGIEEIQEHSNAGKSSRAKEARERKETSTTQPSSLPRESQHRGDLAPRGKTSSARAEEVKRAANSQQLLAREPSTFPGQTSSETELDNLPIYKARLPAQVREKLGFAAPILETIAAGAEVTVLESKGDWFKVRIDGAGKMGYVRREFFVPAN